MHLEKAQAAEETWKQAQVDLKQRRESSWLSESTLQGTQDELCRSAHAELETTKLLAQAEKEMTGRHYLETEGLKRAYEDAVWSTKTIYEGDKNEHQ